MQYNKNTFDKAQGKKEGKKNKLKKIDNEGKGSKD